MVTATHAPRAKAHQTLGTRTCRTLSNLPPFSVIYYTHYLLLILPKRVGCVPLGPRNITGNPFFKLSEEDPWIPPAGDRIPVPNHGLPQKPSMPSRPSISLSCQTTLDLIQVTLSTTQSPFPQLMWLFRCFFRKTCHLSRPFS